MDWLGMKICNAFRRFETVILIFFVLHFVILFPKIQAINNILKKLILMHKYKSPFGTKQVFCQVNLHMIILSIEITENAEKLMLTSVIATISGIGCCTYNISQINYLVP